MPCAAPVRGYRASIGGPIRFTLPNTNNTPHTYTALDVPCGTCILCRQETARQWAVRITHEAQLHEENAFVTLTYNDAHLPQFASLQYSDLQKFWKRLRKKVGNLRYYAVGEYGDETNRPHYHACIFGHAFTEARTILRTTPSMLWTNELLQEAWGMGHVSVGALNFQTAQYTASYVTKKLHIHKQYVRLNPETGELIPLVQPRAFMSLNPAIGKNWLSKYGDSVYHHDRVVVNGTPQKPPKYYDQWLAAKDEKAIATIKERRKEQATTYTPEQNRARARNAHARARNKSKSV